MSLVLMSSNDLTKVRIIGRAERQMASTSIWP